VLIAAICVSGNIPDGAVLDASNRYAARINSQRIDAELQRDNIQERLTIKVLLLGGAESGKTTIFKQMRSVCVN
jgi:ribosome-binding protein aMBF1 (putative translation factor)